MCQRLKIKKTFVRVVVFFSMLSFLAGCSSVATREETNCNEQEQKNTIEFGQNIPMLKIELNGVTLEEINSYSNILGMVEIKSL